MGIVSRMISIAFITLLLAVKGTSNIVGSWSWCTGADATECPQGKYTNVTSEVFNGGVTPIPVNKNFTINGFGYSNVNVTDPSYTLNVKFGALIDDTIRGDACKENAFKFPLNDGAVYYLGEKCPVVVGTELEVYLVAEVADKAPHGEVVATLKFYDQPNGNGNCVTCTTTTLTLS